MKISALVASFALSLSLFASPARAQMAPTKAAPATETATLAAGLLSGRHRGVLSQGAGRAVDPRPVTQAVHTKDPKYEDTSSGGTGHAESLELTFDPAKVSYAQLLTLFFKMHDPTTLNRQGNDAGTQYRSAIFFHGEQQKQTALSALIQRIDKSGAWHGKLTTEVAPAGVFYPAEEYHQKYLVKHPGGNENHYLRNISFMTPSPGGGVSGSARKRWREPGRAE